MSGKKSVRTSPILFEKPPKKAAIIQVSELDSEPTDVSNGSSADSEAKFPLDKKVKDGSIGSVVLKLVVSAICGIFFGIAMEKSRVFEPMSIRKQMVFESFIMLKMFLSAAAAGQFCFIILSVVPPLKGKFEKAVEEYNSCFDEKSLFTGALGAFVLGIGMTVSGACPAMVLIQVGSWVPNAIITMIGCMSGALVYGLIAPFIERITRPRKSIEKHTVPSTFNLPYAAIALPMAILLVGVIFLIEWFWPWTKDTQALGRRNSGSENVVTAISWPPYACGIILGLIQLPIVIFVQDTIGGSSAYVTVVSQWVVTEKLQKLFPYLAKKRLGIGNWWQVFLVCGAVIGGLISSLSSSTLASAYGVEAHVGFFGGFLMIFGARFAAGCTSGHGLSGMGLLVWMSFIAVPFMFGGAIATGFAMQATGALDSYVKTTGAT